MIKKTATNSGLLPARNFCIFILNAGQQQAKALSENLKDKSDRQVNHKRTTLIVLKYYVKLLSNSGDQNPLKKKKRGLFLKAIRVGEFKKIKYEIVSQSFKKLCYV